MTLYTDSFPPNSNMLAPGKRARGGFMYRCGPGLLLTLAITFVLALTGCLGKSSSNSSNGGVQSVTLHPGSNFSIDVGGTRVFSATGRDASGRALLRPRTQFIGGSRNPNPPAPLSVARTGLACDRPRDPTSPI